MKDPETGKIETEPTKQAHILEKYFKDSWQAINIKHGTYLPEEAPRNYPWEHTENEPGNKPPYPFKLQSKVTLDESGGTKDKNWLHFLILDKSASNKCIRNLRNNKSPGPDGIVNELLRMLPTEIQEIIHALHYYVGNWHTKSLENQQYYTNKNKGDETEASSYRPIGLANTLHKLWTRLITKTLYEYAEANSILSTTQAGFCEQKDRIHHLENFIIALEDAKLFPKKFMPLLWILPQLSIPLTTIACSGLCMTSVSRLTPLMLSKISMKMPPPKSSFLQGSAQVKYQ